MKAEGSEPADGRQPTQAGSPVQILGVPVSAIDMTDALATIAGWIANRDHQYVCVNTVNSVLAALDDPQLAEVYRNAGLVTPDGMPLVWISRARGHSRVSRVYGPDLMLACCDTFRKHGVRHFLYGGAEGVPERLSEKLSARFPGLTVAGAYSPPFRALTEDERVRDIERINESTPDIVWVGLGAPKQDYWMAANRHQIEAPVLIGVGAAFDFHAGVKRQAPVWMRRRGLEWLFRLATEPGRLAHRYIVGNSRFLGLLAAEEFRRRTTRV
jgi:N-acetylglucosaminyldiphosphoundecaprenol N-acetyl-beta-D-mannosaminyltransferase